MPVLMLVVVTTASKNHQAVFRNYFITHGIIIWFGLFVHH